MRVGYLTHVKGNGDPGRLVRDAVALGVEVEDAGLDSFWVAQHHLGATGSAMPSPLVLLAAVAARTERIELGVAAIVAPAEHPTRLIEDAAVLDEISSGRLRLALGAGSDGETAEHFGYAGDDRHRRTLETIDLILDHLGDDGLLSPRPSGLRDRLLLATGSRAGAIAAATKAVGLVIGRRSSGPAGPGAGDRESATHIAAYRRAFPHPDAHADGRSKGRCSVVVSRPVVPAASRSAAIDALTRHASGWLARGRDAGRWSADYTAVEYAHDNVYLGPSADIVAALDDDPGVALADELICHTQPAGLDHEDQVAVVRRLGRDILPALRSHRRPR